MEELFEIIKAINRLKDRIQELCLKIDSMKLKSEPILDKDHIESEMACKFLHISPATLKRMRRNHQIPYSKNKRKILYKIDDLRNYLDHK
jgi:hypothetical protein